jgi:hypothetical protein
MDANTSGEDRNVLNVNEIVRRSENPHPAIVMAISVVLLIAIWCLYTQIVELSLSGVWFDDDTRAEHHIVHNRWNNTVYVDKIRGSIRGNVISMINKGVLRRGIVDSGAIQWLNGSQWSWIGPIVCQ